MMLLFTHNVPLKSFAGELYSLNFTRELWEERYLPVFGHVHVLARNGGLISEIESRKYSVSSTKGVDFTLLPYRNVELASIVFRNRIRRVVINLLEKSDCLIARVPSTISYCRRSFLHKFGKGTRLLIQHVEEIPREKSGKFRMIVNKMATVEEVNEC